VRGLLIFIAIAFPIALASPTFWWLVQTEVDAAPVGYGRADGSVQQALLGPKAPWPEWVSRPEGAKLNVKAWFGPGATEPESGFGDLVVGGEPRKVIAAYRSKLEAEGWKVDANMFHAALPEIPPRRLDTCVMRAVRSDADPRIIQASFELAPDPGNGSIHWAMQPMPGWSMPLSEPC
jgi:hypothetical protein